MDAHDRQFVRDRAENRCEYCRLPQHAVEATFHVEHVVARQHQGGDDVDNLALACNRCNLYKGPNLSAIDPLTKAIVLLFHPRKDLWNEHFSLNGAAIIGLTPTGRATVRLLEINAPRRVRLRSLLQKLGES